MRSQQLRPCKSPRFDGFAIGWSKWRDRKSKRPRETRPLIAPDSAARKCLLPAQPCRPSGSRRRPGIHPKRLFEKELRLRLNRTRRAEKPLRESARVIRFFYGYPPLPVRCSFGYLGLRSRCWSDRRSPLCAPGPPSAINGDLKTHQRCDLANYLGPLARRPGVAGTLARPYQRRQRRYVGHPLS